MTCRVLKLARRPCYRWRADSITDAEIAEAYRANALFDAHKDDPEFGYRYLVEEARDAGEPMAERTARRICTQNQWWSVFGKKRGKNGKVGPPVHDDLVKRDFTADVPNQLWLSDITEHRTGEGKLYVCAIKDVFSNGIVGYSIDSRMKSRLARPRSVVRWHDAVGWPDAFCTATAAANFEAESSFTPWVATTWSAPWAASVRRRQCCHGELLQPPTEERSGPPPLGHPRGAEDRHRHLDRTDLPPTPTPGRPRALDPNRIRSKYDHTGQSGCVTATVT